MKKISQVDRLIRAIPGSDSEVASNKLETEVEKIQSCNSSIPAFLKVRQLIAIAEQYQKLHQSKKVKQLIDQAIESVAEINGCELSIPQDVAQSFAWNDIADYAMKYGQYEFVLEILGQIESVDGKISLLINLSDIYTKENKFHQAEDTLDKAKEFLLKTNSSLALSYSMEIANRYAQIGNYYSAIETAKLIETDVYQAKTLTEIALKYAKSPQKITRSTWEVIEIFN